MRALMVWQAYSTNYLLEYPVKLCACEGLPFCDVNKASRDALHYCFDHLSINFGCQASGDGFRFSYHKYSGPAESGFINSNLPPCLGQSLLC